MTDRTQELPPDLQAVVDGLNKSGKAHHRSEVALWAALLAAFSKDSTLTDDQRVDIYVTGMHLHRIACLNSFFENVIFSEGSLQKIEQSNDTISAATLAAIFLQNKEREASLTTKFLTLSEMLLD